MAFKKCENFEKSAMFDMDFKIKKISCHQSYFSRMNPFSTTLQSGERILIVGFFSSFIRMCKERDTALDNKPIALIFSRYTKTGKIKKGYYYWYNEYEPKNQEYLNFYLWKQFQNEYKYHPASELREIHRKEFALLAAQEYSGYGWHHRDIPDVVFRYMEGTNFLDLVRKFNFDRDNRIEEARKSVIENYVKFHEGSSWMNAMFDTMSQPKTVQKCNYINELRYLYSNIQRLKNQINTAHKFEDMRSEYEEYVMYESKFNSIIHENQHQLPRHNIGFIDWKELLQEDNLIHNNDG